MAEAWQFQDLRRQFYVSRTDLRRSPACRWLIARPVPTAPVPQWSRRGRRGNDTVISVHMARFARIHTYATKPLWIAILIIKAFQRLVSATGAARDVQVLLVDRAV